MLLYKQLPFKRSLRIYELLTWALIDVVAVDEGVASVSGRTDAGEPAGGVAADGVGAALHMN